MPIKGIKKTIVSDLPDSDVLAREEAKVYDAREDMASITTFEVQQHTIDRLRHELDRYIDDSWMRKVLVGIFTFIIIAWLTFVAGVVIASFTEPKLSEKILITLLTTTTKS